MKSAAAALLIAACAHGDPVFTEDLRTDAFMDEDFSDIDAYADRAAPAITVLIMGESNLIGVNTGSFLERCEPGTAAFEFFETAGSGFYADGEATVIGTAGLTAWEERTGSSCEAAADPVLAAEWLAAGGISVCDWMATS